MDADNEIADSIIELVESITEHVKKISSILKI